MDSARIAAIGGALILAASTGLTSPAAAQVDSGRVATPDVCKRKQITASVLGAGIGALAGAAVAKKGRKTEGALLGGAVGALVGSQVPKLTACGKQLVYDGAKQVAEDGRPLHMTTDNGQQLNFRRTSAPYQEAERSCVNVGLTIGNPDGTIAGSQQPIKACKAAGGQYEPVATTLPYAA